ncbi:MAG: hypothetical protein KDC83_04260 [Flavobacteriales bacterium]|nr:hypothetical protein [Flavobacteriales bacterium]
MKKIKLEWSYPREFSSALCCHHAKNRGLYQISRIWGGKETLVYIGLVKGRNRQFRNRLREHEYWLREVRGVIKVRFGTLQVPPKTRLTNKLIETIEGVLICEYQPPYNVAKRETFLAHQNVVIYNCGFRGSLKKSFKVEDYYLD